MSAACHWFCSSTFLTRVPVRCVVVKLHTSQTCFAQHRAQQLGSLVTMWWCYCRTSKSGVANHCDATYIATHIHTGIDPLAGVSNSFHTAGQRHSWCLLRTRSDNIKQKMMSLSRHWQEINTSYSCRNSLAENDWRESVQIMFIFSSYEGAQLSHWESSRVDSVGRMWPLESIYLVTSLSNCIIGRGVTK